MENVDLTIHVVFVDLLLVIEMGIPYIWQDDGSYVRLKSMLLYNPWIEPCKPTLMWKFAPQFLL